MSEKRRESGIDAAGLVRVFGLLVLLSMWKWALTPLFSHVTWLSDDSRNKILNITATPTELGLVSVLSTPQLSPWDYSGGVPTSSIIQMTSVFESTQTPYPTYTPYPTLANVYPLSNHRFSFYDPMIGKDKPDIAFINCENWNAVTQYCDSQLRNGETWEANYFISAACPYDLYLAGARFEVVSPAWLLALFPQGFTCKDTGEAVTGLYIDFLIPWANMPMPYDQTPWGTPITLMRLK